MEEKLDRRYKGGEYQKAHDKVRSFATMEEAYAELIEVLKEVAKYAQKGDEVPDELLEELSDFLVATLPHEITGTQRITIGRDGVYYMDALIFDFDEALEMPKLNKKSLNRQEMHKVNDFIRDALHRVYVSPAGPTGAEYQKAKEDAERMRAEDEQAESR
jgi:hypothetical protein